MADPISTDPLERFEAAVRVRVGAEADPWLERIPDLIASVTAAWDLHVTAVANRIDGFGMSIPASAAARMTDVPSGTITV